MKRCPRCLTDKLIDEFSFKNKATGRRHSWCKGCSREAVKKHYNENTPYYVQKANKEKRDLRDWVKHIKDTTPCMDCGKQYPSYVMDFDHRPDESKSILVSRITSSGRGFLAAKTEMSKCDLVCANCHRERTHSRLSVV